MDNISNYETYLFISFKKLIISVNTDSDKEIYHEELFINEDLRLQNFVKLDYFLNKNIFKIEKKLKNFVEKITIIIDLDIFFPVEISVKKNNYNDYINLKNLNHLLYEAKETCKKTIYQKKIIHMLINNYQINDKSYSFLPKDIKCQSYSLDLKLICIPENFVRDLEVILKKYHISINHILSASYLKNFSSSEELGIFSLAKKMINGLNPNEVVFKDKTLKNQGFFEKFFNFFN